MIPVIPSGDSWPPKRSVVTFVALSDASHSESVKTALKSWLMNIPDWFRFNIWGHGNTLGKASAYHRFDMELTPSNLFMGKKYIDDIPLIINGAATTNVLDTLQRLLTDIERSIYGDPTEKTVFVITDGHLIHENEVNEMIERHQKKQKKSKKSWLSTTTKFFTMGLGPDGFYKTYVHQDVAENGNGNENGIEIGQGEVLHVNNIFETIMRVMNTVTTPCVGRVTLRANHADNHRDDDEPELVDVFPPCPPVLYHGQQYNFYCKIPREIMVNIDSFIISGTHDDGTSYRHVIHKSKFIPHHIISNTVKKLYVSSKINHLYSRSHEIDLARKAQLQIDKEIVYLSENSGILSPFTSYVGYRGKDIILYPHPPQAQAQARDKYQYQYHHICESCDSCDSCACSSSSLSTALSCDSNTSSTSGPDSKNVTESIIDKPATTIQLQLKHNNDPCTSYTEYPSAKQNLRCHILQNQLCCGLWDVEILKHLTYKEDPKLKTLVEDIYTYIGDPENNEKRANLIETKLGALIHKLYQRYHHIHIVVTIIVMAVLHIKYRQDAKFYDETMKRVVGYLNTFSHVDVDDIVNDDMFLIAVQDMSGIIV